jgi:glycosyltransferase involved in cell wall biosynthesis
MKVLFISYDGMTDNLGQSQALPYLKQLAQQHCLFHIISLEKKEAFLNNKNTVHTICKEANIKWYPLVYRDQFPVISPYLNYKQLKKKAIELQQQENFDIAHCRSDIPAMIGYYLQRKFQVKFLFDTEGFWADERIEGGIWSKSNPIYHLIYGFFKRKENQLVKHADSIVCLTNKGKNILLNRKQFKNINLRITVIPCCVDLELFDPAKINPKDQLALKKELRIEKKTVFGYLGSIGTWYMLEEMLAFYAVQRNNFNKTVFLFITNAPKKTIIEKAKDLSIPTEEIIVHSSAYKDVPLCISIFDFSIFFIRPTFSKLGSSPTKQGETMAMKVPIICNAGVGDTDQIILEFKAGNVLSPLDQASFESCDLSKLNFNAQKAREGAERWYSLEKGVQHYIEVYHHML